MLGTSGAALSHAVQNRYSSSAMLTCASFLATPEAYQVRIREKAIQDVSEIVRDVALTVALRRETLVNPLEREDDEEAESRPPAQQSEIVPFPFLTPPKGQLLSVHGVTSSEGKRLMHLGHAEHSFIARSMIEQLVVHACLPWVSVDEPNAIREMRRLIDELKEIPVLRAQDARQVVNRNFDTHGRLRLVPPEVRSTREDWLFGMCRLLAERNIVVAEVDVVVGEPFELMYTQRTPSGHTTRGLATMAADDKPNLRERLAAGLGGQRTNFRLWVPLASQTSDYHFFMTAPSGYVFSRQLALPYIPLAGRAEGADSIPRLEHARAAKTAMYQIRPGAPSEAHVLIVNGNFDAETYDIGLSVTEIPLGSTWPATVASFTTMLMMALLLSAKALSSGSLGDASVPALLITLVSNTITLTSSVFGGRSTGNQVTSATARLALIACAGLGNLFAVWWLYNRYAPRASNIFEYVIKIQGGYIILFLMVVTFAVVLRRLLLTAIAFRTALRQTK